MLDDDLLYVRTERDNYKLLAEHWEKMYKDLKNECERLVKDYDDVVKYLTKELEKWKKS